MRAMVAKVLDMWDALVDSKFGAGILTLAVLALVGFVGPAMLSSINAHNSNSYTGTAVVQNHKWIGSFCYVDVKKEDGSTASMIFGPKATCIDAKDGMTLNISEGNIKR
jgi:hypothetical protein